MNDRSKVHGQRWLATILRPVSRSFYLSIRFLPARLREPVTLAYLLARATDTIADTAEIAGAVRMEKLQILAAVIQDHAPPEAIVDLAATFAPLQTNRDERVLIESIPECLEWLTQLSSEDVADVRTVLGKITRGQMLDLQRFGETGDVRALPKAEDLNEYIYLVAGCVGEFWTRLCFRHLHDFADLPPERMAELGVRYGKGLQLINILRDAGSDLRAGRCYFPNEELAASQMSASQILREPERFQPIYRRWGEKAERGVEAGMQYSRAIGNRRVRLATVLPALIGARTIALLRDAGATALHRKIKVPRKEVRTMIAQIALTLADRQFISRSYARLIR
jgi:farnesyl-diphosphate farnesyltransferase